MQTLTNCAEGIVSERLSNESNRTGLCRQNSSVQMRHKMQKSIHCLKKVNIVLSLVIYYQLGQAITWPVHVTTQESACWEKQEVSAYRAAGAEL